MVTNNQLLTIDNAREEISSSIKTFTCLIPDEKDRNRFISIALANLEKNPKLFQCTPSSFISCLVEAARLGLEPGGSLAHCYLISHEKTRTCTITIGYRGWIQVVLRDGAVRKIWARPVYNGEAFAVKYGTDQKIDHTPDPFRPQEKQGLRGVYACAELSSGSFDFEILSLATIEKSRECAKTQMVWKSWYVPMALKTAIRVLVKRLPMSSAAISKVMELDEKEYKENGNNGLQSCERSELGGSIIDLGTLAGVSSDDNTAEVS